MAPPIFWTPARDAHLREMWRADRSLAEIAKHFGTTKDAVTDRRKAIGLPVRKVMTDWTPERTAQLSLLWAAGKSASQVAKIMGGGITRNMVIGKARRLGLPARETPAHLATNTKVTAASRAPRAPKVRPGPANPRGVRGHPAAAKPPKPAPHLKPANVFGAGYVPSITPAEAQKRSEASAAAGRKLVSAFAAPANDDAVLLINRRAFQCSWPVGDPVRPADQLCCGQPVPEDANRAVPTYCAAHAARAISRAMLKGKQPDPKAYERSLRRVAYA